MKQQTCTQSFSCISTSCPFNKTISHNVSQHQKNNFRILHIFSSAVTFTLEQNMYFLLYHTEISLQRAQEGLV